MLIETIGWIGSVLIVGVYFLNIQGQLKAEHPYYIWGNLLGGLCFIVNTLAHKAYPSAFVNIIWVLIAVYSLWKSSQKAKKS